MIILDTVVCDHFIYYLLIGIAYAVVVEMNYRREDALLEKDPSLEYSFWGDIFQMVMLGTLNTLFWPKSIIDEMMDAYLASKLPDDEDDD